MPELRLITKNREVIDLRSYESAVEILYAYHKSKQVPDVYVAYHRFDGWVADNWRKTLVNFTYEYIYARYPDAEN